MEESAMSLWLRDKGWVPLLLLAVINHAFLTMVVAGVVVQLQRQVYAGLTRAFFGMILLVAVFAIVGLYYDRRYVAAVSGWSPSPWYFLMFFVPFVGYLITVLYLYRRYKRVGLA